MIAQIKKSKTSRADLAQIALQQATRSVSARHGVAFDDRIIHLAVHGLGGWPRAYSELTSGETAGDYMQEFGKAYAKNLNSTAPHPAFLPGVAGDKSFAVIGDEALAEEVIRSGYPPANKCAITM